MDRYFGEILTDEMENATLGQYTQVIWPEAEKFGMCVFTVPDGDDAWPRAGTYVVARYDVCQRVGQTTWRSEEWGKMFKVGKSGEVVSTATQAEDSDVAFLRVKEIDDEDWRMHKNLVRLSEW